MLAQLWVTAGISGGSSPAARASREMGAQSFRSAGEVKESKLVKSTLSPPAGCCSATGENTHHWKGGLWASDFGS